MGRSTSRSPVREHNAAATTAGIRYIIGTVAGILNKAITYPPLHTAGIPTYGPFASGPRVCETPTILA